MEVIMPISRVPVLLAVLFVVATIIAMIIGKPMPMPKEQIQRQIETLSLAQRSDLVHFSNAWFIVLQNLKNEKQITLKDSRDNLINTYNHSLVADWNDFKMLSNPNPNNDYSKTLLSYFVGVSN